MKYRKKPAVIEATQWWPGDSTHGVCHGGGTWCPTWGLHPHLTMPHLHTIHQDQTVILEAGDWIIPEGDGIHHYPCKDEVFKATYEAVGEV